MYNYIDNSQQTKDSIFLDLQLFHYYEDIKNYTDEQIQNAIADFCEIYEGNSMNIETIHEIIIEFLSEA